MLTTLICLFIKTSHWKMIFPTEGQDHSRLKSARTLRAEFQPAAPITPPPEWDKLTWMLDNTREVISSSTWPGFMKCDITLMTFLNPIRTLLAFIYSGTDLDGCHCHISTVLWLASGSLRQRAKVSPGKADPRTLSHEIYSVA